MKKRLCILLGFLVCACVSFTGTSAEPALVSTLGQCTVGWLSADPLEPAALPNVITIRGTGVGVVVNNAQEVTQFHCRAYLDFSQPVLALNFWTGEPVMVNLGSFDDLCNTLGICRRGEGGALMIDGTSGFTCQTALGPTPDFQEVVAPSGQVSMVCRLPVRSEN